MLELKGKYNSAKVFTDNIEKEAISQIENLLDQEYCQNEKIRFMPDVHAGKGCVIGTTMTVKNKIIPNLVGVDINCGMLVVKLRPKEIDLAKFDSIVRNTIPMGCNIRKTPSKYSLYDTPEGFLHNLKCKNNVNLNTADLSLGTLGGGNHFIELDKDEEGFLYLVIHSGSRHLGYEVANFYQDKAYKYHQINNKEIKTIIKVLKEQHREKEIQKTLENVKVSKLPKDLCWLEGYLFENYIYDTMIISEYARKNREIIAREIIDNMDFENPLDKLPLEKFETVHNYLDTDKMILRKGAVSAQKDEKLIIPMNMRDGSLICIGKGNSDWNYSAPHGAGRIMSRTEARNKVNMSDFEKSMEGIYCSLNENVKDESPFVYKPMEEIIRNIQDTVEVLKIIKPIYNAKALE